jgi:ATP-dependent Clp protease ATP-binding subunit ClpA
MVAFTQQARHVWLLAQREAERLHHHYVDPEHLLLGLLLEGDKLAARVLRAHGLDLETLRGEVGRLIAQGLLPAPRPSDDALLATLGIDPVAVRRRLRETFGTEAVNQATQRVRTRPRDAVPWPPMGGTPLLAKRVFRLAYQEAVARGQEIGLEHLLLGLLCDASRCKPGERRRRPLVRLWRPPHHAGGGLADHAGGHGLVLAEAVRLFDRNLSLDVPPSTRGAGHECQPGHRGQG